MGRHLDVHLMKPNIVIIVIDALRADRVGTIDGKNITPNLKALSDRSITFTDAYSVSNTTDVAITSLQTGKYPLSHGILNHGHKVTNEEKRLIENVPRLPQLLSDEGYQTAAFGRSLGRWHRKGFDKYPRQEEIRTGSNTFKKKTGALLQSIHPSVHDFASKTYNSIFDEEENRETDKKDSKFLNNILNNFESFINEFDRFYAFIHMMHTHTPYEADPDLVAQYLERFDYEVQPYNKSVLAREPIPQSFHKAIQNGKYPDIKKKYYYSDTEASSAVAEAHYDAATTEADQHVGRIIDKLKTNKTFDDTLIFILSDHGESMTEHGIYFDHHGLYDVSVKIPLIICLPEKPSSEVRELVQITDIVPTIMDYVGVDELDADGKSLKPVIENGEQIDRSFVMAEESHTQRRRMIRTKQEKFIYLLDGDTSCEYCGVQHAHSEEFYDLLEDPAELKNAIRNNRKKASKLRKKAEDMAKSYNNNRIVNKNDQKVEYDDEDKVLDQLDALGYK